ncbi:MAG TPA: SRPBCC family protein [Micromonosporaceae bacterium]
MAKIEGEIVIARPPEVVFDFVADERNEPTYNRRMRRAEKITNGPIGVGTRFRATSRTTLRSADMTIETTAYDRPTLLGSTTRLGSAEIHGTLTFDRIPIGTRMTWSWDVEPKRFGKLLGPIVARLGRRQEDEIWMNLKRYLEGTGESRAAAS